MRQDERRGTEEGEETAQKSRMKTRERHFLYICEREKQKDVSRLEVSERMRKVGVGREDGWGRVCCGEVQGN